MAHKTKRTIGVSASRSAAFPVSRRLGGISVWSSSRESLDEAIDVISACIDETAARYLTAVKNVIRKAVRDELKPLELEDRVFSAVLGTVMRLGKIDSIVCASKNDRPYRVLVHKEQQPRFRQAVDAACVLLRRTGTVEVRDLERELFGERRYNTWSSASHVLGYLAYKGLVTIGDFGEAVCVESVQ